MLWMDGFHAIIPLENRLTSQQCVSLFEKISNRLGYTQIHFVCHCTPGDILRLQDANARPNGPRGQIIISEGIDTTRNFTICETEWTVSNNSVICCSCSNFNSV